MATFVALPTELITFIILALDPADRVRVVNCCQALQLWKALAWSKISVDWTDRRPLILLDQAFLYNESLGGFVKELHVCKMPASGPPRSREHGSRPNDLDGLIARVLEHTINLVILRIDVTTYTESLNATMDAVSELEFLETLSLGSVYGTKRTSLLSSRNLKHVITAGDLALSDRAILQSQHSLQYLSYALSVGPIFPKSFHTYEYAQVASAWTQLEHLNMRINYRGESMQQWNAWIGIVETSLVRTDLWCGASY